MSWLKHVLIDIVATLVILVAAVGEAAWAEWIVLIYTPLMLLLKIVALVGERFMRQFQREETDVPRWFYHLLYGINTGVLFLYGWWLVGGQWAMIWILSAMNAVQKRDRAATGK